MYFNEELGPFQFWHLVVWRAASWLQVRARLHSHLILQPCPQFPRKDRQGSGHWGSTLLPDVDSWEMGSVGRAPERICCVVQTYASISSASYKRTRPKHVIIRCTVLQTLTEFLSSMYKIFLNQSVKKTRVTHALLYSRNFLPLTTVFIT